METMMFAIQGKTSRELESITQEVLSALLPSVLDTAFKGEL
jgi:hypothetical protein